MKNSWMLVIALLASCGSPSGQQTELNREDKIKLDQYLIQGKELYETYCTNCHQDSGEGQDVS